MVHRWIIGFLGAGAACGLAADGPGHGHHHHGAGVSAVTSPDAPPPEGFETVDHEVVVGTVQGRMKFDPEVIEVKPGAKVKLVLKNLDEMQHNLLICRPGEGVELEVAKAAWALGPDAVAKQFVPASPHVLFKSVVVNPHESDTIYFTAPLEENDYPYVCTLPGHAFTMKGLMRVGRGSGKAIPAKAAAEENEKYHLTVHHEARVVRCVMPKSSPRSIAVGLPGGINFCFDAEACFVRYGWFGGFLDTGPDRGRGGTRGGGANQPLGERFSVGQAGFPLRVSPGGDPPKVKFRGYRRGAERVEFLYRVDGFEVSQTVAAAERGVGVTSTFVLSPVPAGPVTFMAKPGAVDLLSDVGTWEGEMLTIPAAQGGKFTVTAIEKGGTP